MVEERRPSRLAIQAGLVNQEKMPRSIEPLSDRRDRMLQFIIDFAEEQGYPPTLREIGKGVGISSTSVVEYHLRVLEEHGYIQREKGKPRAIKVLFSKERENAEI